MRPRLLTPSRWLGLKTAWIFRKRQHLTRRVLLLVSSFPEDHTTTLRHKYHYSVPARIRNRWRTSIKPLLRCSKHGTRDDRVGGRWTQRRRKKGGRAGDSITTKRNGTERNGTRRKAAAGLLEKHPPGIMSRLRSVSSPPAFAVFCRLDPRARRVRFLRGAPRVHNASYCGIRGPGGTAAAAAGASADSTAPARINPDRGARHCSPPPFSLFLSFFADSFSISLYFGPSFSLHRRRPSSLQSRVLLSTKSETIHV